MLGGGGRGWGGRIGHHMAEGECDQGHHRPHRKRKQGFQRKEHPAHQPLTHTGARLALRKRSLLPSHAKVTPCSGLLPRGTPLPWGLAATLSLTCFEGGA